MLDTNVLSELRKDARCDSGVRAWYESAADDELYLSVLVLGEIRQGIERIRLRDPRAARSLDKWLEGVATEFSDHILTIDAKVADMWGHLGVQQPLPVVDAYLAATALVHDLTLVTRDQNAFRNVAVRVLNPFESK